MVTAPAGFRTVQAAEAAGWGWDANKARWKPPRSAAVQEELKWWQEALEGVDESRLAPFDDAQLREIDSSDAQTQVRQGILDDVD